MTTIPRISRRTVLKGLGASLALPWLELMADDPADPRTRRQDPPRMAFFYIPGCIANPAWFPKDEGPGYTLSPTLKHLERHRDQFTLVSGLQHLRGQIAGHPHALNWLTGHNVMEIPGVHPNTISVDQVFAQHFGNTYLPSMVLSHSNGGSTNTLSRNALGSDIPASASPAAVFAQMFPPADATRLDLVKQRLAEDRSVLDELGGSLERLRKDLGVIDRRRLDQYTEAVRDIERRIHTKEEILAKPRQQVDAGAIDLNPAGSLKKLCEAMMDLVVLGFQTDLCRVSTFTFGDEGSPLHSEYPEWAKAAGAQLVNLHDCLHRGSAGSPDDPYVRMMAMRDALLADQLARMMDKLKAIPAKDGTLLDHTQILFGGAQATTHNAVNMPILVAGGRKLGWKHGQHKVYWRPSKDTHLGDGHISGGVKPTMPLSDLFLTMLQRAGCPVTSFKESRGPLSELLA